MPEKFLAANGETITLRPAEPEDAEGIINALKSASTERSYVLMEQYGKGVGAERDYIRTLDKRNNLLLVSIASGGAGVIGILEAVQSGSGQRPGTAHVLNIGVHLIKEFRGLGIGFKMLQYTEEWARKHGFKELEANVFTTNKRSLHLFRKAGFLHECTKMKRIRIGNEFVDEVTASKRLD